VGGADVGEYREIEYGGLPVCGHPSCCPTDLAAHLDLLPLEVHDDPQCRVDAAHLVEDEDSDALA
jgi:hypothetical protein